MTYQKVTDFSLIRFKVDLFLYKKDYKILSHRFT